MKNFLGPTSALYTSCYLLGFGQYAHDELQAENFVNKVIIKQLNTSNFQIYT